MLNGVGSTFEIRQPFLFPVDYKAYTYIKKINILTRGEGRTKPKQLMDSANALFFSRLKATTKIFSPFLFSFRHFVAFFSRASPL